MQDQATTRPPPNDQRARVFPSGVTKAVASFVQTSKFDALPEKAVVEAKRCLIDGFGVVLAGATVDGSAIVREYVKTFDVATRGASVLGPERLSANAGHAALANAASGHAMDYDDTQ